MATFLSGGTRELITDASINALDEARRAGIPDWEAREEFVRAAGVAFDVSAEPPANLPATLLGATGELFSEESESDLCDDCELPVDACACDETDEAA